MNQSTHLEWIPETDVKTSMSPEAEAHAATGNSKHDDVQTHRLGNKLTGVAVSSGESPVKEGFTMTSTDASVTDFYNKYTGSAAGYMNTKTDRILNTPVVPGYIPTLGETQTQDIADMIERENTTFVLTAIAGVSVVILSWMILSKPATA